MTTLPAAFLCCASCVVSIAALPAYGEDVTHPMSAAAFVDSLGVVTHLNYTDGAYAQWRRVGDELRWLGVRNVRDATPGAMLPLSAYVELAQHGARFDFGVGPDVEGSLRQLKRFEGAAPQGSIAAIEGFNEVNNFPVRFEGLDGEAAGIRAQRTIYAQVHGETGFPGVPVYDFTGYDIKHVATRGDAADVANAHLYPQNGEQPAWNANGDAWLAWSTDGFRQYGLPLVITEFGYASMPQSGWYQIGVDERSQAIGLMNGLMDAAIAGVTKTYVYELLDEKPDLHNHDAQMHYGLFRNDYTAKPSAIAIHNLTSILRATRPRFSFDDSMSTSNAMGHEPRCAVNHLPPSGKSLVLDQGDSGFIVVLWNETPFWNRASGAPVNSPLVQVALAFSLTANRIELYDPLISDAPVATYNAVSTLTVDVPNHPVLIAVHR